MLWWGGLCVSVTWTALPLGETHPDDDDDIERRGMLGAVSVKLIDKMSLGACALKVEWQVGGLPGISMSCDSCSVEIMQLRLHGQPVSDPGRWCMFLKCRS